MPVHVFDLDNDVLHRITSLLPFQQRVQVCPFVCRRWTTLLQGWHASPALPASLVWANVSLTQALCVAAQPYLDRVKVWFQRHGGAIRSLDVDCWMEVAVIEGMGELMLPHLSALQLESLRWQGLLPVHLPRVGRLGGLRSLHIKLDETTGRRLEDEFEVDDEDDSHFYDHTLASGATLAPLSALTALTELCLHGTVIDEHNHSTYVAANLEPWLSALTALQRLSTWSACGLPTDLSPLSRLTHIDLLNQKIGRGLGMLAPGSRHSAAVASLPSLSHFACSGGVFDFDDPAFVTPALPTSLRNLCLDFLLSCMATPADLGSWGALSALVRLTSLTLGGVWFSQDWPFLPSFQQLQLRELRLGQCLGCGPDGLRYLPSGITHLSTLRTLLISFQEWEVGDRMRVDESLTTLTSLRVLTLGNPPYVVMDIADQCTVDFLFPDPPVDRSWVTVHASDGTEFRGEHPDAALPFTVQLAGTAERLTPQALMAMHPALAKRVAAAQRFLRRAFAGTGPVDNDVGTIAAAPPAAADSATLQAALSAAQQLEQLPMWLRAAAALCSCPRQTGTEDDIMFVINSSPLLHAGLDVELLPLRPRPRYALKLSRVLSEEWGIFLRAQVLGRRTTYKVCQQVPQHVLDAVRAASGSSSSSGSGSDGDGSNAGLAGGEGLEALRGILQPFLGPQHSADYALLEI